MNELVEIDGGGALLEPPEPPEPEVPLLPQAAMSRAALPANAVRPALLLSEFNETTSIVSGTCQDMWQWPVCMTSPRAGTGLRETLGRRE